MNNHRLSNKRAFVTGGSRGIGAAIVKRLAQEGADVALTYLSRPEKAEEVAIAAKALGVNVLALQADSANSESLTAAVDKAAEKLGGIDILVNNAGIAVMGPIEEFLLEDFDRTVSVNIRAAFVAIQAALKHMQAGGRIINVGSCNAERVPFGGGSVYAMSKAALVGLVKGLARDLGSRGITVNNIQPGPVETDMNPSTSDFASTLVKALAVPRYANPDEVAAMVAYLAGPEAAFVTGASLTIDGGFTA
jgi:3-oxoacyl-[acyl-carrier protein] reductase